MQVVFKNENERSSSEKTNSVDIVLCVGRVSRHLEGKYTRGFGSEEFRIWDSRRVFSRLKEGIWKKRQKSSQDGRIEEIEAIQQRLMESECQPDTIEKWYKRTINLDRNWRKSKKNEQGLRSRREIRFQILR